MKPLMRGLGRLCLATSLATPLATALVHAEETSNDVVRCPRVLGTLAVLEPEAGWSHLGAYGLGSPSALIRVMVQRSACFDVVERGAGLKMMQRERELMDSGELKEDSNFGKGQMQAADFVLTPTVQIGTQTTGGAGGALGGIVGAGVGFISGGVKFKAASTSILVADARSGIQVAAAEGNARRTDFNINFGGWGIGVAGGFGAWSSTPEGKVLAASFLDNFNRIVAAIRDQPSLVKARSEASSSNAAASTSALPSGQMLRARLDGVKAYEEPSRDSKVLATLDKKAEFVATGELNNGFVRVDAANFTGWIQRTLVVPVGSDPPAAGGGAATGAAATTAATATTARAAAPGAAVYTGRYSGVDSGGLSVTVDARGDVWGSGMSANGGPFTISGRLQGEQVSLTTIGAGGFNAIFVGRLDAASGLIAGAWQLPANQGLGGDFSVRRQP